MSVVPPPQFEVVDRPLDIGYLHTGMEKLFEYKKYQQGIVITDRMDYLNPLGNNLAYCMAVEKLLGLEIPERAQVIRVLMCELQRIGSHMVWLGTHALDIGAMTVFFYCFRQRERILNLIEAASGERMTPSYFRIGGLMMDLPAGFDQRCKQFTEDFPAAVEEWHDLLSGNRIFQNRTKGVGVISAEDAIDWGLTGPSLRGSGVWSRYMVRMREMVESNRIIRQALERLRPGPIKADAPKVVLPEREAMKTHMDALIHHFLIVAEGFNVPAGEVYMPIEGSKGELGVYVKSDGGPKPARVHVRGPSFINLSALPLMVEGEMIADLVAVIGSLDIVLGEIDR